MPSILSPWRLTHLKNIGDSLQEMEIEDTEAPALLSVVNRDGVVANGAGKLEVRTMGP